MTDAPVPREVSPQPAARHGEPAQVLPANTAPPDGRPRLDGVMGATSQPVPGIGALIVPELSIQGARLTRSNIPKNRLRHFPSGRSLPAGMRAGGLVLLP